MQNTRRVTMRHLTFIATVLFSTITSFQSFAQNETVVKAANLDSTEQQIGRLYNSGVEKLGAKNYSAAILDFDAAIQLKPGFQEAFYNRGIAKFQLKNYAAAIIDLDSSNNLKPTAEAMYFKGKSNDALGKKLDAFFDYSKSVVLNPDYKDAYYFRGGLNFEIGKYTEAIADYTEVINRDKGHAFAYNDRGSAKRQLNDFKGAIEDYNKAVLIDGSFAIAFNNLASANEKTVMLLRPFSIIPKQLW